MFPRNWSEELIAEWYELKGYLVETGVPLLSGSKGGRAEIDIIAVNANEICHVEVGVLGGNPKSNLNIIKKKFSPERRKAVEAYIKNKLNLSNAKYSCRYIASWVSKNSLKLLRQEGFHVDRLENVIRDEIIPGIESWKKSNQMNAKSTSTITPPQNLWLICFLDFIAVRHRSKVLK